MFENEPPTPGLVQKIDYGGGSTDFELPLKDALTLIRRYPALEKVNVFFVSDGSAGYPASVLQQLRYDPAVWGKIEMDALGFGHRQTNFDTLKRIS